MTSQLNVDTIVDKAGSGGTNVKIANTSVTVAEGGSATTTTVQGLAKVWANFDGSGTPAFRDSLNAASITDNGTGDQTVNFTNNMNNDDFSRVTAAGENANTGGNRVSGLKLPSTSSYRIITMNTSATDVDCQDNCSTVHGDLA